VKFPYSIRPLKGTLHTKIVNAVPGQRKGYVQVGPERWILSAKYADFADTIYNFEARSDDVYITTFPRSGTTWTCEMIWLICNNLDYETAQQVHHMKRFPFMELHACIDDDNPFEDLVAQPLYDQLAAQTSQRFIKTHLSISLMPRNIKEVGAKVVYVARNPKDVVVSFYNFHKSNEVLGFNGNFETFAQFFTDDLVMNAPYWKHVLEGWNYRADDNVHFMFYEDLKFDMENSLKKLSVFLGHPLEDEDLPKLMNHLQFESFKKNTSVIMPINAKKEDNGFIRRGKVGGNPEMTKDMSKKFDEWTEKNLKHSDLKFPFC